MKPAVHVIYSLGTAQDYLQDVYGRSLDPDMIDFSATPLSAHTDTSTTKRCLARSNAEEGNYASMYPVAKQTLCSHER